MAQERLEEIRQVRLKKRQALIDAGLPPYPAEVRRTHDINTINRDFEALEKAQSAVITAGRISGLRRHGGLVFIDLKDASATIQLQITRDQVGEEVFAAADVLDHGDWIQVTGTIIRTQRGVKTIQLSEFHMLSKSIRPLPDSWSGLKDHETRYRHREADLWLNDEVRAVFIVRSRIIQWLRQYFVTQGYTEVETPVLQPLAGGAAAKPFTTHHNALDMPLYLRIATELYLKRLLVGGFEKVFEIERRFRNEGLDRQHNPEFTMLESQWAYADYEDLMDFTENIFEALMKEIKENTTIEWQGVSLSFAKPFKRLRYVDIVSEKLGVNILSDTNPETYISILKKKKLPIPEIKTYAKLVDELYKELIRPTLIQPTILYDYPIQMAPLAKANLTDPRIAEKFQLIVHGLELVNAYTELNDPVEQRNVMETQQQSRTAGDHEAQAIDEEYLQAMEYGMPPNAGWGLGIDRLTMLLTNQASIRDTITFPLLKPEDHD